MAVTTTDQVIFVYDYRHSELLFPAWQSLTVIQVLRLNVIIIESLWNFSGISAAMCLSNFRVIGKVQSRISRLRELTRSCGKKSAPLVNRGPGLAIIHVLNKKLVWQHLSWKCLILFSSFPCNAGDIITWNEPPFIQSFPRYGTGILPNIIYDLT